MSCLLMYDCPQFTRTITISVQKSEVLWQVPLESQFEGFGPLGRIIRSCTPIGGDRNVWGDFDTTERDAYDTGAAESRS